MRLVQIKESIPTISSGFLQKYGSKAAMALFINELLPGYKHIPTAKTNSRPPHTKSLRRTRREKTLETWTILQIKRIM